MTNYKPRIIKFEELYSLLDWNIKIYTISKDGEFNYPEFCIHVKNKLLNWLDQKNSFNPDHEHIGFLILHAGTEGLFSIINWWVGKNMLNTSIYFTEWNAMDHFKKISGDGLAPCVWELEVINYERIAGMNHVLKKQANPDYQAYLMKCYNGEV